MLSQLFDPTSFNQSFSPHSYSKTVDKKKEKKSLEPEKKAKDYIWYQFNDLSRNLWTVESWLLGLRDTCSPFWNELLKRYSEIQKG